MKRSKMLYVQKHSSRVKKVLGTVIYGAFCIGLGWLLAELWRAFF